MRICVFEDRGVDLLEPLTLTRPAFDLRCGVFTMFERHCGHFNPAQVGALVRAYLEEITQLSHPRVVINDPAWLQAEATVMVNGRWLPPVTVPSDLDTPHVALIDGQVAYAVLSPEHLRHCSPHQLEDCLEYWKGSLPHRAAEGRLFNYPWQVVDTNAEMLRQDFAAVSQREGLAGPSSLAVAGPKESVWVHPSAQIEPMVVANTTKGPVMIEEGAVVQAFTRLEGPCYIGPGSMVAAGAKIAGATIGPMCKVGGEVEASIVHGYSNKYHDGFLGHSYLGEWVNLAAGTQMSDLRNDYQPVSVHVHGQRVDTGLTKVGSFIGDHTKTGLNTLLNTGSSIGAYCNLLPVAGYLPRAIPSFCGFWNGQLTEEGDLGRVSRTVVAVMARRGVIFTPSHEAALEALFKRTAMERRQAIRESMQRKLQKSL